MTTLLRDRARLRFAVLTVVLSALRLHMRHAGVTSHALWRACSVLAGWVLLLVLALWWALSWVVRYG